MSDRIPVKNVTPVKIHIPDSREQALRYGAKSRIYVRSVQGPLETFRRYFGFIFLAMFAVFPWIRYDGNQAILLDIGEQRFNIFGLTLWPQDLTLLAWIFIIGAFALFFVTTFAGRVWCGFMCPQTTWTYMFVWLEEKIEGSRHQRMKLDERALDFDKFWRKTLKHLAWWAIALLTSLTFVGYFTPIDALFLDFLTFNSGFWLTFWVLFFAFCTYGNAGWMREIMCTHICPYARFQSVMFDKDTYTVTYDLHRGEDRGPRSRKASREELQAKGIGDCIDCNLCVQVCPTGIDIRNGLQYECINCGACVDACNGVMEKMDYPKGLISYNTENRLNGGSSHILRPKLVGYAVVLLVMISFLVMEIMTRVPLQVDIIRDRTQLYRETSDGLVENVYILKVLNKSQHEARYRIELQGLDSPRITGDTEISVQGGEVYVQPISVAIDPYKLTSSIEEIQFKITALGDEEVTVIGETKFLYR
ncbi:cytochrome c oxidase accessory protein CcoG [Aliiglaciecola sp. CAU 1673]|uniref:cytochrome c oxidase accessory protein CcoG n=1 Tax=Aliiglaciecola sp. CAU 1673 TaxID=3032595 RepID=UPI0023DC977F|nr:cytochrome c oxidase accessory protein CcoG [Aliiglaciecola sp. CAU 1673]MDF2179058.1 cytochrome c oxidase accessory protein CcoG [Aliiglaciecola sp. CAU 1673]